LEVLGPKRARASWHSDGLIRCHVGWFRDRGRFGTFFRTVFGDRHQAAAVHSLLQEFVFDKIILFFTEETYGSALGYDIE
ncbi:hypothetical protein CLOM_g1769, partial [Closterium sp. NIES-68]